MASRSSQTQGVIPGTMWMFHRNEDSREQRGRILILRTKSGRTCLSTSWEEVEKPVKVSTESDPRNKEEIQDTR